MALGKGTQLGPYEVLALIGEGGMGQVYRATDTRLNRAVAIKVLPPHFSDNPEMKERFEREAQTVAGLSHPHICTLHDVGQQDGTHYLVMELLEGETLAQRLERGPMPVDEALKVGIEIADALDKAHRQGVVHRDLKPANVMLTKTGSKLLDFGLAKLKPAAGQSSTLSAMPTNVNVTAQGAILGTLQYMAPEQLEGREADSRTDIFAFGALMYEMVTGKKAFEGRSQASLISSIMSAEPRPLAEHQPATPSAIAHIVRTCFRKDPEDRWQTAHDLFIQLQWLNSGATPTEVASSVTLPGKKRGKLHWVLRAIAALLIVMLAVPAFLYFRGTPAADEVRFLITPPNMPNPYFVSISPDGRQVAFVASAGLGDQSLFVRRMGSTEIQKLPGTDGAQNPFWSPDNRSIGFVDGGKLRRIDVSGGSSQNIAEVGGPGTWSQDGTILFMSADNRLYRVPATGGEPTPVTSLDPSRGETGHFWPHFLPDGRHFLYTAWSGQESNRAIYAGSLDSTEPTRLVSAQSMAVYAPGYLLFQREGTLFAQAFDAGSISLTGEPFRVADQVAYNIGNGRSAFAASQTGTLIYRSTGGVSPTQRFSWFDRSGTESAAGEPGPYLRNFALSPDDKRLAVSLTDAGTSRSDIWLMDWATGVTSRFTYEGAGTGVSGRDVVWSPDGQQLAFSSYAKGNADIALKKASGVGSDEILVGSTNPEYVEEWSPDGKYIVYGIWAPHPTDLWAVSLADRKPFPVVQSPFRKDEPHVSFDGKWLAYSSEESGRWQVYVISFPGGDQRRQVSTNGGGQPRWRRDGKELYYLGLDGKMMAVDIVTSAGLNSGIPRPLFDTGLTLEPTLDQYAVTSDGQRFLVLKPVAGAAPVPITVVVNWAPSLKQ